MKNFNKNEKFKFNTLFVSQGIALIYWEDNKEIRIDEPF